MFFRSKSLKPLETLSLAQSVLQKRSMRRMSFPIAVCRSILYLFKRTHGQIRS